MLLRMIRRLEQQDPGPIEPSGTAITAQVRNSGLRRTTAEIDLKNSGYASWFFTGSCFILITFGVSSCKGQRSIEGSLHVESSPDQGCGTTGDSKNPGASRGFATLTQCGDGGTHREFCLR